MVVRIEVAPETESRLREQAGAAGKEVGAFVSQLIEESVARRSLEEVLLPLRRQFVQMNVSDEELIGDITAAQSEYRRERQEKAG
jgi:hypothetical protein